MIFPVKVFDKNNLLKRVISVEELVSKQSQENEYKTTIYDTKFFTTTLPRIINQNNNSLPLNKNTVDE